MVEITFNRIYIELGMPGDHGARLYTEVGVPGDFGASNKAILVAGQNEGTGP